MWDLFGRERQQRTDMSAILSFAGWSFLPGILSTFIHDKLISFFPSRLAGPGTAKHNRDRRIIYSFVVLAYLLYNLYSAYNALESNFYDLLGVPVDVDQKTLRTNYRRLSTTHHPDKGGEEETFRVLRLAYDTLADPVTRFAYDRFGKQVVTWDTARTYFDYMTHGFRVSLPFYVGSAIFILGLSWLHKATFGAYWRTLALCLLLAAHWDICARSDRYAFLRFCLPGRVQFEHVSLLQSFTITVLIAISQVGPMLFPPDPDPSSEEVLAETAMIANVLKTETAQALQIVHLPFPKGNTKTLELYDQTTEWMMRQRLAQDPEVAARLQELRSRQSVIG